MKKIIRILFSVLCICMAVYIFSYNIQERNMANDYVVAELPQLEQKINNHVRPTRSDESRMPVLIVNGHSYIGVLEIPSVNIDVPILDKCTDDNLKVSPCLYYGNYLSETMILAGHNYKGGVHFNNLKKVKIGDDVTFTSSVGIKYTYTVTRIEELKPNEVDRMIEDKSDLTLYTCTTDSRRRLTVRCTRKVE